MTAVPVRDTLRMRLLSGLICRTAPLVSRAGIDPDALVHLLRAKMVLERRVVEGMPPMTRVLRQAGLTLLVVFYVHVGLALGGLSLLLDDPRTYGAAAASMVAILVLMPLVLDVGHLLLDDADLDVVATLPVGDRTLLAVRFLHVASLAVVLYLAVVGPALPFLPFAGWGAVAGPVAFVLTSALATATAVGGLIVLVLTALRWIGLSRVEDVVIAIQIGLVVVFYGGTQVFPHVAESDAWVAWFAERPVILAGFPPLWPGAQMRLLVGAGRPEDVLPAVLGGLVAVAVVLGLAVATGTGLVGRLIAVGRHAASGPGRPRRHGLTGRLGRRVAPSPLDLAGYRFFLECASGDRSFKRRVYPTVIPMVLWIVPLAMFGDGHLVHSMLGVPLAVFGLLPVVLLEQGRYSENAAARWLFETMTEGERARFARGAALATVVRAWFLPTVLYVTIGLAWTGGSRPDVFAFGTLVGASIAASAVRWLGRAVPFTRDAGEVRSGTISGTMIVFSIVILLAIGLLAVAANVPHGGWVGCVLVAPYLVRQIRRIARSPGPTDPRSNPAAA